MTKTTVIRCHNFVELHLPVECPNLKSLDLSGSKVSRLNLRLTPCLERLDLEGCHNFVELYLPVECPNLQYLNLDGSMVSNLSLGQTPHIVNLTLKGCYYLQEIQAPTGCLKKLVCLTLSSCLRFKFFRVDGRYSPIPYVVPALQLTAKSRDTCPLHPNSSLPKFQFKCFYDEPLPSSTGNLEKLISFGLCACTNLESFSASICGLQYLRVLTLEGSIPEELINNLYQLESLQRITLWIEEIKSLPNNICEMKYLKCLNLSCCKLVEKLPEELGRLECLGELNLAGCRSLRDIPNNICNMKCLKRLQLRSCILVEKLPEKFGRLKCLKELNIDGVGISRLPLSIYQLKCLRIIGSREQLESYGFTSLTSRYVDFYVEL